MSVDSIRRTGLSVLQPPNSCEFSYRRKIMQIHDRKKEHRSKRVDDLRTNEESTTSAEGAVPEIYQVVIECRHEREQRAVFERMRAEGYRCRVLTL